MNDKPPKYGTQVYSLIDAPNFYVQNLEVYLRKRPDGKSLRYHNPTTVRTVTKNKKELLECFK